MKILISFLIVIFCSSSSFALSISWEIERGFRYFKYNSDFELHRLAWKASREKSGDAVPSVHQLDELLSDPDWWSKPLGPKTSSWYGYASATTPERLVKDWREREIHSLSRPEGYFELAQKMVESGNDYAWEYHPARLGWANLLFPSHQSKETNFADVDLINPRKVAVCWNRGTQRHDNCGSFENYINPDGHTVFLRAMLGEGAELKRVLTEQCSWSITGDPGAKFVEPATSTPSTSRPCSDNIRIFIPAGKKIAVTLTRTDLSADASILVKDFLVAGFGDSFASGEGNPDVPVKLKWTTNTNDDWATTGGDVTDHVTGGALRKSAGDYFAAQWIDRSCHRSAYSYQLRAAMHLALTDPTRAITFVSYACSGAEVNEGLFQPYNGVEETDKNGMQPQARAQFPVFLAEFCNLYDGDNVKDAALSVKQEDDAISSADENSKYRLGGLISDVAYRCARQLSGKGFKRSIDLLYLSVGGNDLGFSRWIMKTITGTNLLGAFLPVNKPDSSKDCSGLGKSCEITRGRLARFSARYKLLRSFIDERMPLNNHAEQPVIMMTYPLPLTDQNNKFCPSGSAGMTVWANSQLKMCVTDSQGNIKSALKTIDAFAQLELNGAIQKLVAGNASRPRWIAVSDYGKSFEGRGFCASRSTEEYKKRFPAANIPKEPVAGCSSWTAINNQIAQAGHLSGPAVQETLLFPKVYGNGEGGGFGPFRPMFDYLPYAHRTRLVRTINDAQLIVDQLNGNTQAATAAGVLSLQESAIFGAFHPTGEAHSMFADSFVRESEILLAKNSVR